MRRHLGLFLVMGLAAGIALLLGWQYRTTTQLRVEVARQRGLADVRARLKTEQQQLMAGQVSPEELEKLRSERAVVTGLVAEIEAMKRRAEAAGRAAFPPKVPLAESKVAAPSLTNGGLPAGSWKNAGQANPEAAFETVLWASAGGDVDALAGLLFLDEGAKAGAQEIATRLPATLRQEMATPERLIALLTARDVPLGSAQILGQYVTPEETKMSAQLVDAEGNARELLFTLRADDNRWRLVVPQSAVEKYAATLQAPTAK